jgi:hypothetical protein
MFATDNSVRQYAFGGGDGNRTHVHNNFETTSTNTFSDPPPILFEIGNHYNIKLFKCQSSEALAPHLARFACVSLPKSTGHS